MYLGCPAMEADALHAVSSERLEYAIQKSEVCSDKLTISLFMVHTKWGTISAWWGGSRFKNLRAEHLYFCCEEVISQSKLKLAQFYFCRNTLIRSLKWSQFTFVLQLLCSFIKGWSIFQVWWVYCSNKSYWSLLMYFRPRKHFQNSDFS
jgi:hypothetical protein